MATPLAFNQPDGGVPYIIVIVSDISLKARSLELHFCRRKFGYNALRPKKARPTDFAEITQNNGHYDVQGHSRSPILVPIESSYACDFLLVININLPAILHRFRDIAFDRSKIAIFGYPLVFNSPTEGFPWDVSVKFFVDVNGWPKVPNAVEILPKITTA